MKKEKKNRLRTCEEINEEKMKAFIEKSGHFKRKVTF